MASDILNTRKIMTKEIEEVGPITQLAEELTAYFNNQTVSITLLAPESLTVKTTGKGYTKAPHIGGEAFRIQGFYVGKKNSLVMTLSPQEASNYTVAEVILKDAFMKFDAELDAALERACEGGYAARIKAIRDSASDAREQELVKDKFDQYADIGFGTF